MCVWKLFGKKEYFENVIEHNYFQLRDLCKNCT